MTRSFLSLLFLLFLFFPVQSSFSSPRTSSSLHGVEVILDQSHGQIFSPYNPAFEGYSQWTMAMVKWGVKVRLNSKPLTRFLPGKGKGIILVMGIGFQGKYSRKTLLAIRAFVKRGGGLLVMTEHDNMFQVTTHQNRLAAMFGMKALPTGIFTRRKDTGNPVWIDAGIASWDLQSVRLYYVAPLVLQPSANPLLFARQPQQKKHRIMAGYRLFGKGVAVLIGDAEFTWNGVPTMGLHHKQNLEWTKALLLFLAGRKAAPKQLSTRPSSRKTAHPRGVASNHPVSRPTTQTVSQTRRNIPTTHPSTRPVRRAVAKGQKRDVGTVKPLRKSSVVWFVDSLNGLSPQGEFRVFAENCRKAGYSVKTGIREGELSTVGLAVVPPLTRALTARELRWLKRVKKILFIGDGYSDLLRKKPAYQTLFQKLLHHKVLLQHPALPVTTHFGFQFCFETILSTRRNGLEAMSQWQDGTKLLLRRATPLCPIGKQWSKKWKILVKTSRGTWSEKTLMGIHHDNGKHEIPFSPPSQQRRNGGLPVVMKSANAFVVGDVEPFLNTYMLSQQSRKLWKVIQEWLRK